MSESKLKGPISPSDIAAAKAEFIPNCVFDAFNELIAKNYTNGRAKVEQSDVKSLLAANMGESWMEDNFSFNMLNVEESYREKGWSVTYDKPAYNESYSASFLFKAQ